MPSYSQEQITPVADVKLVDQNSFPAKIALLKKQPNAPQGDEKRDFKTAVYLCACLNNFSFEDALTSSNSAILSFMLSSFYQGFKGESNPIKTVADYLKVLQELIDDGALEHLGPGLGFVCPGFKIEAEGKITAKFMTYGYGTELHFVNGVYDSLVFSRNVIIPGDEVKVVINGLTNIATVIEITKMRTMLVGEYGQKRPNRDRDANANFNEPSRLMIHERGFENIKFEFTKDSLPRSSGDLLIVEIVKRNPNSKLTVRVREIVQDLGALQTYIIRATLEHDIPNSWPLAITENLDKIPQVVTEQETQGRVDLRQLPLVTIDGDDAKDFDDAVYCEKQGDKFRLYVAIADVSYYVRRNTALDKEAVLRCNSVYFPYYVIPMLPVELSNGICSLNPKVDRLCMVCDMIVNKQGKIEKYDFYPAVMNSHARLTYTEAFGMLETGKATNPEHECCVPWVKTLYELYQALKQAREQRGAFEFEGTEVNFVFDEHWKVIGLEPETRNEAHMLIEECMIAANICAATFVKDNGFETLYRVHPAPTDVKLDKLRAILSRYGIDLRGKDAPTPQDFKRVSQQVAKLQEGVRNVIGLQLLRSMSKATYHPENIGHFGLALENYAHFTSPIRRYPDLQLHRVIKYILEKKKRRTWGNIGALMYTKPELLALGMACSERERAADDAEFDVDNSLKCDYVKNFISAIVPGTVSTVMNNAVFVTLNDFFIDGRLDDVMDTDPDAMTFRVSTSGNVVYRLGEQVMVRIMNVRSDMRHIQLTLVASNRSLQKNPYNDLAKRLKKSTPLPPDSVYDNSFKDELFNRIADFSRGKTPTPESTVVRDFADFGLEQKLIPAATPSKKPSKMAKQMSDIKSQLMGSITSASTKVDEQEALAQAQEQQEQAQAQVATAAQAVAPNAVSAEVKSTEQDAAANATKDTKAAKAKKDAKAQAKANKGQNKVQDAMTTQGTKVEAAESKAGKDSKSSKASKNAKADKPVKAPKNVKTQAAKTEDKVDLTKSDVMLETKQRSGAVNTTATLKAQEQLSQTVADAGQQLHLNESDIASFGEKSPFEQQPKDKKSKAKSAQTKAKVKVETMAETKIADPAQANSKEQAKDPEAKATKTAATTNAKAQATAEVAPTLVKVKRKGKVTSKTINAVEEKPLDSLVAGLSKEAPTLVHNPSDEEQDKTKTAAKAKATKAKTTKAAAKSTAKAKAESAKADTKAEAKVEEAAAKAKATKTTKAKATKAAAKVEADQAKAETKSTKPTKASAKTAAKAEDKPAQAEVKAEKTAPKAKATKATKAKSTQAAAKVEVEPAKAETKATKAKTTKTVAKAEEAAPKAKAAKTTKAKATKTAAKVEAEPAKTETKVTKATKAKATKTAAKVDAEPAKTETKATKATKAKSSKAAAKVEADQAKTETKTTKTTKAKATKTAAKVEVEPTKAEAKNTKVATKTAAKVEAEPVKTETKATKSTKAKTTKAATKTAAKVEAEPAKAETKVEETAPKAKATKTTKAKATKAATKTAAKVEADQAKAEAKVEETAPKAKATKTTKAKATKAATKTAAKVEADQAKAEAKVEETAPKAKATKTTKAKATKAATKTAAKVEAEPAKSEAKVEETASKAKATKTTKAKATKAATKTAAKVEAEPAKAEAKVEKSAPKAKASKTTKAKATKTAAKVEAEPAQAEAKTTKTTKAKSTKAAAKVKAEPTKAPAKKSGKSAKK